MIEIECFIDYLKVEKRYSGHTVRAYSDDIAQFSVFLKELTGSDNLLYSQQKDVRAWIISLVNNGLSPRTLRRKSASIKTFYNYCLRKQIININPVEGITLPKINKSLPKFIKESAMGLLFEPMQFSHGFSGIRDQLILELFYATGMRLSELTSLKTSNFDIVKGEAKILGKRNKERIIPLTPRVIKLVDLYINALKETGFLLGDIFFLTDKGLPVYPKFVQRLVRKYLLNATTLEKKSPHLLRHTFATHMLNNGADLNVVKELLGHASLVATEIYTHNTYEKLKSIYKQAHPRA